ncbi:hypothetical protein ANO11243_015270 [Dothideomycetidae sp. 11243]|nr:hypothetical protein ANO11243_015270 [fungal sp. No.11243]
MSEYWKSTPKYWCKFCKIFVRDTSLEKKQHESTGKHQGAIQKSLRDLHKNQGREERDAQRAKDEVARLNGLVSGKGTAQAGPSSAPPVSVAKSKPTFTRPNQVQATAEDRKRQAAQLAALGVVVPDEFRKDMALAGEWSTVSQSVVYPRQPPQATKDEDDDEDSKDAAGQPRHKKRKLAVKDDDDLDDADTIKKRAWGASFKAYPGSSRGNADDFDSLLSADTTTPEIKREAVELEDGVKLKKEESIDDSAVTKIAKVPGSEPDVDAENAEAPVVFKRRKGKR